MPKKTKKAKLIAEYRRKLHQLDGNRIQVSLENSNQTTSTSSPSAYTLPQQTTIDKAKTTSLSLPQIEFALIQKDLHYTLGVVGVFFAIELIIWKLLK